jgi:hypothetical protein
MNMKKLCCPGALLAALCLAANVKGDNQTSFAPGTSTRTVLYAQNDTPSTPPPPLAPPPPLSADTEAKARMKEAMTQADAQFTDPAKRAQAERDRLKEEIDRYKTEIGRTAASFPPGFSFTTMGSGPKRALVIRTTEMDAKTAAAAEEDLNVMGRILEKALYQTGQDDNAGSAMGIKLFNFSGQGGAKYLQLEGYGAVFMLSVNFPLAGPSVKAEEDTNSNDSNSTWDEAKRELYGQPGNGKRPGAAKVDYDPQRVEKLKDSLVAALKNASNMRAVKPDESVTLVVTSGGTGEGTVSAAYAYGQKLAESIVGGIDGSGGGGGGSSSGWSGGGNPVHVTTKSFTTNGNAGGSTLVLSAKKADIDDFAKGKLSAAEFRTKAKLLVY